jgi:hypothetical protein
MAVLANVSRKAKIRIAAAGVFLIVAAVVFLQREFSGDVKIIYAGVSPEDHGLPSFTVTNSYRRPVVYYLEGQLHNGGAWQKSPFFYTDYTGHVMARSTETFAVRVGSAQPWKVFVIHNDSWMTSSLAFTHIRLMRVAAKQNWPRFSKWLEPPSSFRRVPGPEMLGKATVENGALKTVFP